MLIPKEKIAPCPLPHPLAISLYTKVTFSLFAGGGGGGMVQHFFWNLIHFFDIQSKNTSKLILLSFKGLSERFFSQGFQNRSYFLKYVI
jgi:hypothetical protein